MSARLLKRKTLGYDSSLRSLIVKVHVFGPRVMGEGEQHAANAVIDQCAKNPGAACDLWSNDSDSILRLAFAGAWNATVVTNHRGLIRRASVFSRCRQLFHSLGLGDRFDGLASDRQKKSYMRMLVTFFLLIGSHDLKPGVRLGEQPLESVLADMARLIFSHEISFSNEVFI